MYVKDEQFILSFVTKYINPARLKCLSSLVYLLFWNRRCIILAYHKDIVGLVIFSKQTGKAYRHTQEYKLQLSTLKAVGSLCLDVSVSLSCVVSHEMLKLKMLVGRVNTAQLL